MRDLDIGLGNGFAIITAVVLIAAILYTVIKLKQQVRKAEDAERKKSAGNLNVRKKNIKEEFKPAAKP